MINSGSAYCSNLNLQTGATLTQNDLTYFHCYGTFDAGYGQFTMSGTSYLYFNGSGNTNWWDDNQNDTYTNVRVDKSVNTASMTMKQDMTCSGNFEVREGIFKIAEGKTLTINSASSIAFQVEDGGTLSLNGSQTIDATGGVDFQDGSQLDMTAGYIKTGGNLLVENNASYDIHFNAGWLYMTGTGNQYIQDQDGGNLQLFSVSIFKPSGVCYIANADLDINGSLFINGGTLSCRSDAGSTTVYNINVGRHWTNNVGSSGFDEATGRVIFDGGNYHQYCYTDETFNELEVNKPLGGAFRIDGTDVVCAAYDWTAGAVDVLSGSFTANDLIDNGIYGAFYLNSGGTINLTNSGTGTYVDLNGELHIFGGTMNVTGSVSWWPFVNDASVEMSGGVLDFKTCGIYINNSGTYTLTENITGGTIRTSQGFSGNRADFTPTAGTFEFYGSTDYYLSQSNGCTLYDVNIDKSTKNGSITSKGEPEIDIRSGMVMGPGSKSNTIGLSSDFVVTNDLTVTSGEFKLNGHSLTVTNNVNVYGTFTMDNSLDILTVGSDYLDRVYFYSGSTGNFSNGIANIYGWILPFAGCSFTATTNNTVYYKGVTGGGPSNYEPTAVYGNIIIDKNANQTTYIDNSATEPIVVNGSFTINPDNIFEMQNETMIVHGTFTDASSSEIYVYNTKKSAIPEMKSTGKIGKDNPKAKGGYLELDNDFTLNGLLNIGDGDVLAHGLITQQSSGTLTISGGTYSCDASSGFNLLYGTYNFSDGLMEFASSHIKFYGTPNITGGTVRAGRTVIANDGGFVQNGGTFEFTGSTTGNYIQFDINNYINYFLFNRTGNYVVYPQNTAPDFIIKGNVTINSGTFSSNGNDIYVGGDWTNNAGASGFEESTGTVVFDGTGDVSITPGETFYNLTLDKASSGDFLTLSDNVIVLNDLIVNGGSLHTAANILDVNGDVNINSGAVLFVQAGGTLRVGDNNSLTGASGSFFYVEGSSSNQATLTHSGSGRYACDIYGEIAANYATFEYMNGNGVFLHTGSTVNPVYTFNHCIFRNGAPSPSALLATLSTDTFTSTDTYFENTSGNTQYNVWKNSSSGNITFNNYSGDFAGPEFEYDPNNQVSWGAVDVDMALTVMLEGPYNGSDMNTDLNTLGLIPLSQPFNSNSSADWYYTGTESVASIPPNVVDWVLVKIKDAADAVSSAGAPVVAEQAAFLLNDGSIVDLDGSSNLFFPGISYSSGLYPVVWHRNHLGVISANKMTRSGGVYTYDFTGAGSAYSDANAGETDLGGGVYGLWGGDSNGTGWVYDGDIYYLWKPYAGEKGYRDADFDLNGQLDNKDKNDVWFDSYNKYSQIPGSKNNYSDDTK